ncbi:MAG: dicarboxylate/amino acid:cation symporter [Ramlibacter sp.]
MGFLTRLSGNPLALLACVVAGALVGIFLPELGTSAAVLSQLYLAVVSMAALPLLLVATFFGLRQTMALPQPGLRVLMIAALAVVLVLVCAAAGTLMGAVAAPGQNLGHDTREYLGGMVQSAGGDAASTEITLMDRGGPPASDKPLLSGVFPDNFFRALAEGKSLGILLCAILFGLAFAALSRTQNNALTQVFEAIYRALEIIISRVNLFIPLLVFGVAASFFAVTEPRTVAAMQSFLWSFMLMALVLGALAVGLIARQSGLPVLAVLQALKAPALISLTSASTTASIPDTIEAMSTRLGFSRGVVELVTPISSVFLRSGSALYYALLAVFVANLYGRALTPDQLALICAGSALAAFASAGSNSLANVAYASMVLALLQLPAEAALALFLAIDLICEAPRNWLTLMFSCALMALVSRGLPSERQAAQEPGAAVAALPVRFAFTRSDLMIAAACSMAAALLIVMLGIGVGLRRGEGAQAPGLSLGHAWTAETTRT